MRRYLIALVVVGSVAGGFAGSAAADDETPRRICLMTTDDPKNQGPEPICVRIGE